MAGWAASFSAIVAAVGLVFLILLYAGFVPGAESLQIFGPLNDLCIIVQYVLALPIAFAFHQMLKQSAPQLSRIALLIYFIGVTGIVVFQALLLTGVMTFNQQVLYASIFLLIAGVWVFVASRALRKIGAVSMSQALIVFAALYIGYPFWAYRVGQQLRAKANWPA